jgi:glycosyltransferase involved in cell wall biosynthesis
MSTTKSPAEAGIEVSAVIPCLNEARTIGVCVQKARRSFAEMGVAGEVVVVDNGSTDGTAEVARESGARVIHESVKGYGVALHAGIEASQGRIIVMGDGDDSYDWGAISPFVAKLREGYDLVAGNRFAGGIEPGAMPLLHRYLGTPMLSALIRLAFGVRLGDVQCGMRAFTREAYARMRTAAPGMEFVAEMVIAAAHQGLRIAEVPTRLYPDKRGRAPHLRTFRDGWRNLRLILTHAPDYLYLVPGTLLLALGLVIQGVLAQGPVNLWGRYFGIHYLALGAMLSLVGFNVLNLGVLAKAVMAQRFPALKSRVLELLTGRYTLETGLIAGVALMLLGIAVDAAILAERIAHPGQAMQGTVHLAFVATTIVVLGLNLIFSAFLLAMMLVRGRDRR